MDWKHLLTSFEGRINRARFWAGVGALLAIAIAAGFVNAMLGIRLGGPEGPGILALLAMIGSFYLALAICAKRWHDRGKSGWWSLILLVPVLGPVWLLVELGMIEGTKGINRYGPDPLG